MGRIRRLFLLARYQGTPTEHVVHLRRGRTVHCGVGLAFWFRPALAAISEVPATDHERPVLFHVATRDQQDVTVQAVLTYRFVDPETAARRLDLAVHPVTDDAERVQGVRQVADLVGEVAQSLVVDVLRALDLPEALSTGLPLVRDALVDGMRGQERLAGVGVEVCDVRVLSLRPEADIEKALQTPLREQLQTEADRALYERRALAVEREQQISVNELASKLEVARRREALVAQEGANRRREAEERAAAALVDSTGLADRTRLEAAARAEEVRQMGAAQAEAERARTEAYAGLGEGVLRALALREAAGHLPSIGQLTLTPDLLTGLLGDLLGSRGGAGVIESGGGAASTADSGAAGDVGASGAGGAGGAAAGAGRAAAGDVGARTAGSR